MRTKEKLARALEELNDPKLAQMILKARGGYYDDYESTIATPISTLVNDLRAAGYPAMARRAIDGEWDATMAESEEWAKSPEAQAIFKSMVRWGK